MATFTVKSPILHDGEKYEPGDQIELSPKQAEAMPWAVSPVGKKEKPAANGNGKPEDDGKK